MTFVASLLLSTLPQVFPGNDLKLPPRTEVAKPTAPRPATEVERFKRDLVELQGPQARVEQKLQEMAQSFAAPALESLIVEVARGARANEMNNLMVATRRFGVGSKRVADELLFQLLARPLAEATRPVVETMATLKGDAAKAALHQCIRGRLAPVRRHAVEVLTPMLTTDDLPFALELSREANLDLQLRGIDLLRALPSDASARRLCELLSKDPVLAGAACLALVGVGEPAVPALQQLAQSPPIDRGFAYACFALARLAEGDAPARLPDALAAPMGKRFADPDPLSRCLLAVPLADLAFRGVSGASVHDAAVVDALLDVVHPLAFVPNLDMLRRPCEERLLRTTGRIVTIEEGLSWRAWWKDQQAGFCGVRARVDVGAAEAPVAVVSWRQEQRHVRFLAEGLADVAPVNGATEVVLSAPAMLELTAALQAGGFGDPAAMRHESALPRLRSLAVQVPSGRAQVSMPTTPHPRFDALLTLLQTRLDEEAWQLFRDPVTEPERGAFWRAERAWLEQNPSRLERGRRFVARAVQRWPNLSAPLRARAVEQIAGHPDRKQLLGESDGDRVVAMLDTLPELGELDARLLELAASVPGDRVWRAAVDVAARKKGGGAAAVRAVFAVLGPDAVLAALQDPNPLVRRAGIEEIMVVRDQRAADRLVELLDDPDLDVQRTAAAACGHLPVPTATRPLILRIAAPETTPAVRRECLRSLGRVGGDGAFQVLQRALLAKGADDKEAAMRGLGDLRDPRAAHALADLMVVGHGRDLGTLARLHLLRQSGTFAIPALRAQLQIVQDPAIRDQVVLLAGSYHDAAVVPELMDLLRKPQHAPHAAQLLEGSTGVALAAAPDRIDVIEAWYREHRTEPQWTWLLAALRASEVPTALKPEQFSEGAGLVPVVELARLLVELEQPRLWALTAAVLRTVAHDDFGPVSADTPLGQREAIAARYRVLVESSRAAAGK